MTSLNTGAARAAYEAFGEGEYGFGDFDTLPAKAKARWQNVAAAVTTANSSGVKVKGLQIAGRLEEIAESSHSDHDKIRLMIRAASEHDKRLASLSPAEAGVEGDAKPVAWVRQSSLDALETETIGFEGVHTLLSAGKSKWCTVPLYTRAPLAEADRGALEALEPFTAFAEHAVERLEDGIHAGGWVWRTSGNERISDWFGPSDFGSLLYFAAALTHPSLLEEFEALGIGRKFQHGDRVTKIKGSSWTGQVVGFYSTSLTLRGYAVESENEPGSVQIYPEAALRPSSPGERR